MRRGRPVPEEHDDDLFSAWHGATAGVEQRGNQLTRLTGGVEGQQPPLVRLRRLVEPRAPLIVEEVGLSRQPLRGTSLTHVQ